MLQFFSVLGFASQIFAQNHDQNPLDRVKSIYLLPNGRYAEIERVTYPDQRLPYIRNERFGRYLNPSEEQSVVSAEYFTRIRDGRPYQASLSSLVFFNAGGRYIYPEEKPADLRARVIKGIMLGVTALGYFNAASQARHSHNSIRYINSSVPARRFERARQMYFGVGLLTVGYHHC